MRHYPLWFCFGLCAIFALPIFAFYFAHNARDLVEQDAVILATNIERKKAGLPPLSPNEKLSAIAKAKAVDMVEKQYLEHIAPDGTDLLALTKKHDYRFLNVGENLIRGNHHSGIDVVRDWMTSPGHRANILNTTYTEIGVAALRGNWNGRTVWYVVQEFGRPLSACPSPDPLLKERIDASLNQIATLEATLTSLGQELEGLRGHQASLLAKTKEYNAVVQTYGRIATAVNVNIERYASEVRAFNACAGLE